MGLQTRAALSRLDSLCDLGPGLDLSGPLSNEALSSGNSER